MFAPAGCYMTEKEVEDCCKEPEDACKDFINQQTMIRIKEPKRSLDFYTRVMGMRLIQTFDQPIAKRTLFFLGYCNKGDIPERKEDRIKWLFLKPGCIELWYDYDAHKRGKKMHNGNCEPLGYGHIGIAVPHVKCACDRFEELGVEFEIKYNAGLVPDTAFIRDPDGYWIEIINGATLVNVKAKQTISFYPKTTCLLSDPRISLDFYTRVLEMRLLQTCDVPHAKKTVFFLGYAKPDDIPKDNEDIRFTWLPSLPNKINSTQSQIEHYILEELPFNLAVLCLANMSGLADFIPTGEIEAACKEPDPCTQDFINQQTMIRIKDPRISLDFYTRVLGMRLLQTFDVSQANKTLFFLGYAKSDDIPKDKEDRIRWLFLKPGIIELSYTYGAHTNVQDYHNGNKDPLGFGHIGIAVPDVKAACKRFEELGVEFQMKVGTGKVKDLAFIKDPDGYWIEILNGAMLTKL
ncbi:uncharacterized protein LOC144444124 [Glandiceps talaboti]